MTRGKKITIVILSLLIVALIGVSLYVALGLGQTPTPDDTGVTTVCDCSLDRYPGCSASQICRNQATETCDQAAAKLGCYPRNFGGLNEQNESTCIGNDNHYWNQYWCPGGFDSGGCNQQGVLYDQNKPPLVSRDGSCGTVQIDCGVGSTTYYFESQYICPGGSTDNDGTDTPPPPPPTKNLKLQGQVTCKDPGVAAIPLENVQVSIEYTYGGETITRNVRTAADGSYSYTTDEFENIDNQRFKIYVNRVPQNAVLPTGQKYSDMVAPTDGFARNCSNGNTQCTSREDNNYCGTQVATNPEGAEYQSYRQCRLPLGEDTPTYSRFRFDFTNCSPQIVEEPAQCIELTSSSTIVSNDENNSVTYTVRYESLTKPYSENVIQVRIADSEGNAIDTVSNPIYTDEGGNIHAYTFTWDAAGTNPGEYDVVVLPDGETTETVVACQSTVTVTEEPPAEPDFSIIKTANPVCLDGDDAQVNYTITVRNLTSIPGVIQSVVDELDPTIIDLDIQPSGITPSYGTYSNGVITWTGTLADRTFSPGQSKNYSYSIVIPNEDQLEFTNSEMVNMVTVTDENSNVNEFIVVTDINCDDGEVVTPPPGTTPDTAIDFSDTSTRLFLSSVLMMLIGFMIYRFEIGRVAVERLFKSMYMLSPTTRFEDKVSSEFEDKYKD